MNNPNQGSSPKNPADPKDAARVQSHADKTGTNQGFKARFQSAADKNVQKGYVKGGNK